MSALWILRVYCEKIEPCNAELKFAVLAENANTLHGNTFSKSVKEIVLEQIAIMA